MSTILALRGRLAEAHVDDDLLDLGDRHHVLVAELLGERRHDFLAVSFLQAAHLSTTPSHLRQIADLAAVAEDLAADARRLAALGAHQLHVATRAAAPRARRCRP